MLWYFGYGSNVDRNTFLGRRRMRPRAWRAAALDDHALVFDLAVGPGERGVANLREETGARVWGVAWEIDAEAAGWLDRTEGVHRGFYLRKPVTLVTDDGPLAAFTYQSGRGQPGRKPSRRYLGLLLAGARQHGLPEAWVAGLRALPLAVDERDGQRSLF